MLLSDMGDYNVGTTIGAIDQLDSDAQAAVKRRHTRSGEFLS